MFLICVALVVSFVGVKEEVRTSKSGELVSREVQYRKTIDGKIVRIEKGESEFLDPGCSRQVAETVYVQIDEDADAIARHCAISGDGRYIFVNWELNYERASLYQSCLSPGMPPIWEYDADDEFQGQVGISFDGNIVSAGELNKGYQWNKYSGAPLNIYNFGSNDIRGAQVARDGSKVLYLSYNSGTGNGKISVYDANTYASLWEYEFDGYPQGFDCTPHGDTVAISTYDSVYIFNVGGQLGQGLPVDGWQFPPAISANGQRVVTGDYDGDMRIYQWFGVDYAQIYSHHVPSSGGYYSWVDGVDISDDGQVVLMGSSCYIDEDNYAACFKYERGFTLKWKSNSPYHKDIKSCRLSADGSIGIVGCVGKSSITPAGDVVCIYNTSDSIPFLHITNNEEPGSIIWVDIDTAGEWACASGKAINIYEFGRGGQIYCIHIGEEVLKDIAAQKVISPPDSLEIGDYTPTARYMNIGSGAIDTFMVYFEIYDSLDVLIYKDSSEQYNLLPIWVREVAFSNWTCSAYGWYRRLIYAYTDGDQYAGNDSIILYSYCEGTGIEEADIPLSFYLSAPSPNPARNSLDVFYALPEKADVTATIYDVTGRIMKRIARKDQKPGYHHLSLDMRDSPAGIYFINVSCGKESQTVKSVIVK